MRVLKILNVVNSLVDKIQDNFFYYLLACAVLSLPVILTFYVLGVVIK